VKLPRRNFLHLATSAAALPALSRVAAALDYPTRPVRIIVGYAAAGPSDIVGRLVGQWLSDRLGQQFIVENRPGAGSNIGTELVLRAPPDGYTLLLVGTTNAINATLYRNLNFNFIHDIAPVASIMRTASVMAVNPSFPAKTVPEFITFAKANPGKINMATAGVGSPPHVYGELFNALAGTDLIPVHYRGGGLGLVDLLAGQVQVMFEGITSSIEYVRAGKLRALAVTTAARSEVLTDVPTVGEFVPGYEASGWFGLGAPDKTPGDIIDKLHKAVNASLVDPKVKARIAELGGTELVLSTDDYGKFIAAETEKWGKVIRTADMKPE
jgi:tripartite-type tricarboxylate transporter receptor subunit TctC